MRLTAEERGQLAELVSKGKAAAYQIKHANVLLKVDADGPHWSDEQAAEAFSCAPRMVFTVKRFVEQGLEAALERKKRVWLPRPPKLDGEKETRLIQLAYSEPPAGHARWTFTATNTEWSGGMNREDFRGFQKEVPKADEVDRGESTESREICVDLRQNNSQ